MPLDKGKLQKLYSTLKQGGYSQSYDEFEKGFTGNDNYPNRKKVYDLLTEHGADIGSSYEEFMGKMQTSSRPQQQSAPAPAPAPKPKPAPKPRAKAKSGGGMTAAQRAAFINSAQNIVNHSRANTNRTLNKIGYTAQKLKHKDVGKVHLGYGKRTGGNGNVMVKHKDGTITEDNGYSPQLNQALGNTYVTESGNEYDAPTGADFEQTAIDNQKTLLAQYNSERSVQGRLKSAYEMRDELEKKLEARRAELEKQRESRGTVANVLQDMGNIYAADKMGGVNPYSDEMRGYENDPEYMSLMSSLRKVNSSIQTLETIKTGKGNSFWQGLKDTISNGYTFNDGLHEMRDATAVINAQKHLPSINKKLKSGKPLTHEEQVAYYVLRANVFDNDVQGQYQDQLGAWYRAGSTTGTSLDFMKDIMLTGGGATSMTKGVYNGIVKKGAEALAKRGIENGAKSVIAKGVLKATGIAAGTTAAGAMVTNTTGFGRVGAETATNVAGQVGRDKDGNFTVEGNQSLLHGFVNAERDMIGENQSEMFGEFIPGGGKYIKKGLEKIGLSKISGVLTSIGNKKWYKQYSNLLKAGGWNGLPGEAIEEYEGMLFDALTGNGEQAWQQIKDPKTHIDIWLGCATTGALLGAVPTAVQIHHTAQYYRYKHKTDSSDKVAALRMTQAKWEPLKDIFDNTDNEHMADAVMDNVVNNKDLSHPEKVAALNYVRNLTKMRGYNISTANNAGEESDPNVEAQNEAYGKGYNATDDTSMNDARNKLAIAQQKLDEAMKQEGVKIWKGYPNMQSFEHRHRDANSILEAKWDDGSLVYPEGDPMRKLAQDVVNAQQEYEGMMQRVRDDIDDEVQQTGDIYDSRTNDKGVIQSATLKAQNPDGTDRKVYITSGNVVMTDDGKSVDRDKSDMSIVVVDDEGKVQMISPDEIFSLDAPLDGEQAKQQAIDAIKHSKAQEAADKINGKVDYTAGNTYTLTDSKGQQIEATIVADEQTGAVENPDGSVNVSMGGKIVPMAKETFQQMVDATNMQRTAQGDSDAAQQSDAAAAQQQPTEQSDENGNEEGSGVVPSYPGSVVAPSEPHQWQMDDTFVIDNGGVPVRGQVTGIDADGVEIYTESPINGKKMQVISPEELQSKVSEINGEAVGVAQEDAAAQQQPTEQSGVNWEQAQEQAPQTQEQAQPQQTEEPEEKQTEEAQQPQRAIDRIPSNEVDDGKGKVRTVHQWEQAEPGDTYDALSEIYHGNADRVKKGVQNRISAIDKQIKATQKQMDAIDNSDDFDAVAAQGEKYDQLQQQKSALEQQKKYWQGVQNVPVSRRAEQDKRTEEEKAAAKAERAKAEAEAIEKARQERERVNGVPDVINDTPSDARKRGFRNVNGMVVNRQGDTEGVTGRESSVKFSSKDTAKGKVKVIEADQLQPSHVNGQRNHQFFIDEAQPKDRTDTVSSMAAAKIASNLNPEEITGDGSAYQFSAPTVNSRGEVIQGNNRSDALKLMYSTPAFKPAQDVYKQYIIDHAADFGFTPEDVEKIKQMQHPVMVNELGVDDDEAIRLGQMKASDNESGGIERIDPVTTSQKLGAKVGSYANILLSSPDEDASLSDVLMQNGAKTVHWLSQNGIISNTAAQSAFDRKGNLTPEARMDLLNILKQSLFQGGVSDLPAMFDKMPAKAQKAILNTFMRDFDSAESERILPEIQKAIEAWYGCAMSNEAFAKAPNYKAAKAAMHDWTLQTNLLDDNMPSDKFSNFAMELACRLQGCSMRETQQSLNDFFDLVQGKSQGDLFGGTTLGEQADRKDAIKRIFNIEYNPINNKNNGKNGSNAVANDNSQSGEGRPGSTGDGAGRERAAGTGQLSDVAGGTEGNDEKGINSGAIRTKDGGYKKLPTGYAYRITDAQEVKDVIDNGMFRKMPDDMIVPGSNKVYTSKSGRKFSFGKQAGNTHGGKAFAAGMPWGDNGNGGTTSGGSGEKYFIAIPGNNIDGWRVGHHGHYSDPRPFDEIEEGKGLWLPFDEDGDVADLSTDGMRVFKKVGDTYYEVEHPEDIANHATQQTAQPIGSTSSQEHVESEREAVNTEPTEKQKEAGNYKKGHIKVDGFDITIENPKGSTRSGTDASGKAWSVPMKFDYGYIKGTEGVDGDHIDVYLSDDPTKGNVYVVDQVNQEDGTFDEHKVMYGFPSMEAAIAAYKGQYEDGWKVGTFTEVSREDFKKWVESSKRKTKPFADYKSMETAAKQQRTEQSGKQNTEEKLKKANAGQFGLVSDERMEELKKRLRAKLNNLNMGVDPEVLAIGLELTAGYIDRGVKKFAEYSKAMINDLGDVVRPYLKAFYNGVRDMPEITSNGLYAEMDDYETVSKFNVATIGKEGEEAKPSILDTAEQVSNESHVERQAEKQMEMHQVDVMGLMADLSRGRTTSLNEHFTDNDVYADTKAAHDNMMKQLDKLYRIHGRQAIEGIVNDRDHVIDFYKGKLDRGETQGEAYGSHAHVDYARSLARAIGEREAAQEFIDKGFKVGAAAEQRPTEPSEDSSNSNHSGNSDDSLVEAAKETGHLVVGGVPKSEKISHDPTTKIRYVKGEWSGLPKDVNVTDLYEDQLRPPHAFLLQAELDPYSRVELIHSSYGDFVRVHIFDEHAETPVKIRRILEKEGYNIDTNNYSSGYADFKTYKEAMDFVKHVDEVQSFVDDVRSGNIPFPKGSSYELEDGTVATIKDVIDKDHRLVSFDAPGREDSEIEVSYMRKAIGTDGNSGGKKEQTRYSERGFTLRPATEEDVENHATIYVDGKRTHIVMLVRKGEQVGAAQFSKPEIEAVYTTDNERVPLSKIEVEDVPKTVHLKTAGDFYEAYGNDAVALAMVTGVSVVTRKDGTRMAGFPKKMLDEYEHGLRNNGWDVSVDGMATKKATEKILQQMQGAPKAKTSTNAIKNALRGKKTSAKENNEKKKAVSSQQEPSLFDELFGREDAAAMRQHTEQNEKPRLVSRVTERDATEQTSGQGTTEQKPTVITTDDEKGKEKPIETKPEKELSGDSKEYQERAKAEQEFVERIRGMITDAAKSGESLTMSDIKKAYNDELDGNWELKDDYSDTDLQELVERAMTLATREVAIDAISKNTSEAVREGYDKVVKLYESQPSLNARDSTRVAHQQYSTPTPFGYVMDWFLRNGKNPYKGFEPSAGNGALTIGFPAVLWHVNDIDERRLMNLRTMPYGTITNQDGTMPFEPKAYDMVATNPPFGSTQEKDFDGGRTKISSLEGLMAINALASMKDDGRAAIIIGGNTQYMSNGAMQAKDMKLFRHLYTHYNVVDVINLDGDMYKRNGTGYNVRMILIAGRKTDVSENPEKFTFPPVKKKARAEQVKTFDELYKRVEDDIQQAKQMERESPVAVNSDGSNTVNSASERTGDSEATSGVQQRPVRAGEVERRTQPGRTVRPTTAQDGRGNGERGQHGSTDRLDNADGRDAGSNHAVPGNRTSQGQSSERREGGSLGRGTVGGAERGRAAERDNANGERPAVTGNSAAAQQRPTEPSAPREKVELGQEKVAYPNKSQSMTLQSRVPAAQAEAIAENLDRLGDVDEMVRSELGYSSKDELFSHLAAEQIDSVALAINQMKQGKGFIIGDMTGVGKGRQGAALIRWAIKQGKTPIYFTQKARLYTDNYRDMCDIGSKGLHPFLIASNDDGNIVENVVDENGEKVYDKNGEPVTRVVYGLPKPKERERVYNYILQNGKLPKEYDYVLVTYSQIQSGTKTYEIGKNGEIEVKDKKYKGKTPGADKNGDIRRDVLKALAKGNYVFLDESHTVGGQSSSGLYMQDMLKNAEGVTYLSATFAKRPDNMPLYAMKTAMSESGLSQKDMIDAIQKGGVTLQEIMSKQLVQSGQMIRRERDFTGVSIDWEGVDEETDQQQRAQFDEVAKIFNAIREFQDNYVDPSIEKMSEDMAEEGKFSKKTQGTSHMGVNNVPFASKMYNLVNQLLFSLKANAVADKAIECLKKGEKPVISFNNTMEGFLDDMPRNTPMPELPNFSLTLMRALEGTLRYTEGEIGNKDNQVNKTLNINDLGDEAIAKYNEIRKTILNLSIGLPIDPMDAIKMRIEAAGYKVGEITGRKSEMVRDADGNYIVQSRSSKEMDGKAAASAFNSASGKNGGLDVLLINKSGSTGISLHASSKFSDQSPRVMIAAQFQSDINDEVQMRGRIDRTGQVHRGRYIYLVSSIPAEQRLQMMFKNKLKSLDANTTSSQKSKFNEMEVTDFMNKYGDIVTEDYMREHPDLEERLGDPLDMLSDESKKSNHRGGDEENNPNSGCAGKILRRLPFLSVKEQEQIFNDLAEAYKVKMQILNDAGENDLEITTMPLRAETKSRKVWKEGSDPGSDNAFADNTYLETAEVDVLKKPMKANEVREYADRLTDGKPWEQWHQEQHEAVEQFYADKAKAVEDKTKAEAQKRIDKAREDYIKGCLKARKKGNNKWSDEEISHMADIAAREAAEKEQTKINNRYISIDAQRNDVLGALDAFTPLEPLIIPLNLKDTSTTVIPSLGTFLGIKFGKGYSRSSSTAVFATLDGRRKVEVPLSDTVSLENIKHQSIMLGYQARGLNMDNWNSKVPTKSRKTAYIVTGNLMQAIVDTQKSPETKGQLISYTTIDGDVKQGILMNDRFKVEDLKTSVPISAMLQKIKEGDAVESTDKEVKIERGTSYHYNDYKLSVPKSKSRGGKYFLDKKLLRLLDDEFITSGSNMTAWVSQQNLKNVLDYLSKALGVTVQVKANLEEAGNSPRNDEPTTAAETEEGCVLYREVDDEEAARLDNEPTVKVYRAMQEHDGKLYPPMSGRVKTQVETKNGTMRTKWVWRSPIEIGKWEQSEEHPEMANEDGTFTLDKGNGSTINAAYNPYIHTSRTPINDQFSSAWNRPELVTVEVEVPVSELTSGYHAEKAKDSTGEVEWKSGPVGREMAAQGKPRMVILSRWDKPVRIVSVDEVADEYAVRLAGTGIKVPFNTVPPALRDALVARGVEISEPEKGNAGQASRPSYEEWLKGNTRRREGSGAYSDEELSLMNDPVAKWLGKSNRTKAQQKAFANRERKGMEASVKRLAKTLHLDNVNIVMDTSTLKGRKSRAKGFYDRNTNEITIVIPNHRDVEDVMQTLLHEGVAHYGLRKMFGSHFDTFLDNVYAAADNDVRRRITELALSKYGGDFRVATEEYLASLAEQTDFKHITETFWQKIKSLFLDMLHAIGFENFASKGVTLSDNELRYILWRSYENLIEPGRYRSILGEAEDVAMQADLKVGNYSKDRQDRGNRLDSPDSRNTEAAESREDAIKRLTPRLVNTFKNWAKARNAFDEAFEKDPDGERTLELGDELNKWNDLMDEAKDAAFDYGIDLGELLRDNGISGDDLEEYDDMFGGRAAGEPQAWGKRDMLSKAEQVSHGIDPDLLFRDAIEDDDNTARETYNRMADEAMSRLREAWQDSMINVRNLQEAVLKQRGEKMEDWEDAYNEENRSHGKSRAESEYFTDNLYNPLLKAVNAVAKAAKVSVGDVTEYMMAKHGLERNVVFASRDAQKAYDKAQQKAQEEYDALMNAAQSESDPNKKDALEKRAQKVKFPDYNDLYLHFRQRDYSGLTALTGQSDAQDAEVEAQRIVTDMESRAAVNGSAQNGLIDELWKATNAATEWTLRKAYESGMMSRDNYDYVRSMFNNYIPLRGWEEDTAGDLYDYVGSGDKGTAFSPTLHKAKGRRSQADNPIAYIGSMAVSAIVQGNKNKVKQTFMRFAENHPTNLVTVSEMWYRNYGTDTAPDWREDVPYIPEDATADEIAAIVKQHEDDMEQLEAQGMATKQRGRLHLGVPVKKGQALEHHVEVMVNGKKYVLYINGNPRAAQTLNGTRMRRSSERSFESSKIAAIGRKLSERYTSLSPSFTASNMFRDLTMAAISTAIKENPAYALRFRLNVARLGGPARMFPLMRWYRKAVAEQLPMGQMSGIKRYFYEFMTQGAETGFTSLKEIDTYKDDMQKMYKHMNQSLANPKRLLRGLSEGLEYTNRCIEDMTRFAIYITSRESGRSVRESVSDAKNITLNFNRKGSGELGNSTYRNLQIFVNPAIQSLQNVASMAMDHPVKFSLYTGMVALIGAAQVFATQLLWSMFGGGDGDDDKWNAVDEYWKLPTWQRRNNLVMWIPGTKKFAMIPLAQEFRVFHGFGETLTTTLQGKSDEKPALELMSQTADLLPLDFAGNNGNMLVNLAPTVVQPLLQVGFNTDFTGRPLYKDTGFNKYEPSFQKAYVGTPSWLVKSSEILNDLTGGDEHKQGWWERTKVGQYANNPAVVYHLLKGYYGGMYSFLAQTGGAMLTAASGKLPDVQEVPVANRVVTAVRETEQSGKQKLPDWYYDIIEENARHQNEFSGYKKDYMTGDADGKKKFNALIKSKDFAKWQEVNTYIGAVQQIRTAMSYTKDPAEKAELQKNLDEVLAELKKLKDK